MQQSFYALLQAIAAAPTEQALRATVMDHLSEAFAVQRWGIYLVDSCNSLTSVDAQGVSDTFIQEYQAFGKSVDPVLQYVVQHHAPAHEALVLPPGGWKQCELYQRCCATQSHEHIMTGPIVGQGQLVGTLNFARVGPVPAFNQLDLAHLSAVCSHFSTRLAELRAIPTFSDSLPLTARERQIAGLVAKGLTNAEIGATLWISQNSVKQALKRIFRKLDVSARAELVAKLYR